MSHVGQSSQAPGLGKVFDILSKEPPERLVSLTILLGESPEDSIIHALCLLILQREGPALDKLHLLGDNSLANYLAEKWETCRGQLEDFGLHCHHFQEFSGESLAVLARIFKVLSERRLCDPRLRNLAYHRAVSVDGQQPSSPGDLEYDPLREEAKVVCGPEFEELMSSSRHLTSDPPGSLDETLRLETDFSLASPLEASNSMPSYPTHIEVSIPPTALFQEEASGQPHLSSCVLAPGRPDSSQQLPSTASNHPAPLEVEAESQVEAAQSRESERCTVQVSTPSTNPQNQSSGTTFTLPRNSPVPEVPAPHDIPESEEEEEDEAIFYAFVILHAEDDTEVAEQMRERMESISGCQGATFSGDFAIPGRTTLTCLEDAINNSAFAVLLLTQNFNTRLLETNTEAALINSINNTHKHNTVIPLIPKENAMPRGRLRIVLQTIIPLAEDRNFEKKVQKFLSQAKVTKQKQIWEEGQRMKSRQERREELRRLNQYQRRLIQDCIEAQSLERENLTLRMEQNLLLSHREQGEGDGRSQPSIHIEHANYIVIGDHSQMTVDHCGPAAAEGDNICVDERQ